MIKNVIDFWNPVNENKKNLEIVKYQFRKMTSLTAIMTMIRTSEQQ